MGQWYEASRNRCVSLFACPASVWAWTSGPRIPLAQAAPTRPLPDGRPWCYYYGRGIAGGGSDGGDPWAVAFDRVEGKAVTFFPLYTEVSAGMDYYPSPVDGLPVYYPQFTSQFAGVLPYYGAPSSPYSTTLAAVGGSKCAPNGSYEHAWYPSDCRRRGESRLVMSGAVPLGVESCVLDMAPANPIRQATGVVRVQIGAGQVLGAPPQSIIVGEGVAGPISAGNDVGCVPTLKTIGIRGLPVQQEGA
jgi:hypothetical protein